MTGTYPFESAYGEAPVDLGRVDLPDWHEFMHYLYLPVVIPLSDGGVRERRYVIQRIGADGTALFSLPPALQFLLDPIRLALRDAAQFEHLQDAYVYVTARRGYATPGNPLNRPGWHCDDFGGTDLNYIWTDRYPTRFLTAAKPLPIPEDDQRSMVTMSEFAAVAPGVDGMAVTEGQVGHLLRLSPYVIHDTPQIPEPGGMRSFFKISVSSHRYNLLGNSHNHDLDYDWPMVDRAAVRNQPGGNSDYVQAPS